MSITDHETGNMLIDALPLLPGDYPASNLLEAYGYLGIGSAYLVSVSQDDSIPTLESLGTGHLIVWSDNVT